MLLNVPNGRICPDEQTVAVAECGEDLEPFGAHVQLVSPLEVAQEDPLHLFCHVGRLGLG